MTASDDADLVDAITAALSRVRGRRGPGPHMHHGPHGAHDEHAHGGSRDGAGDHSHAGAHGGRSAGEPTMRGMGGAFGRGGREGARAAIAGLARTRLLEALAAARSLSVGEIGEAIGVDQPRASRLVQQAQQMGFVEREADPEDARRTRVVLTEQGKQAARGVRGERRESIRSALSSFTDAERSEFARLLAKFADGWPEADTHR